MPTLNEELRSPRVRCRRGGQPATDGACVLYWMQHAQRAADNPALNLAVSFGNNLGKPVAAFFGLTPSYPGANLRHYQFMLEGLTETERELAERGIPLLVQLVSPEIGVVQAAQHLRAAVVVSDENPVRIGEAWRTAAAVGLSVPFYTVDADVICPSALFEKEEYAARTIRPKIHRVWQEYLTPPGNPAPAHRWAAPPSLPEQVDDLMGLLPSLPVDRSVGPVTRYYRGGPSAARTALTRFLSQRLAHYDEHRNLPQVPGTSELSAYLHFGQISIHAVALAVLAAKAADPVYATGADGFLEEAVVRRELAINYCLRNPRYDELAGCPDWALKSLAKRARDPRPYVYSLAELEAAATRDALWNAAQTEMNKTGRMHGYLRMYWAKKILEWTRSPEEAFTFARTLNDKLFLDGRDPNGYTGIAWAIGGKHDRPWAPERPIFGLVRYMSFDSTSRKFDWRAYTRRVAQL